MKRLLPAREPEGIEAAVAALAQGELVVLPTDTVYGVAADPAHPEARRRLCAAKGRDADKPIPLLASSLEAVLRYGVRIGDPERRLATAFWPGPLTLVLAVDDRTEGFRIPDHPVALEVIRRSGGVLRVTSANRSGEPAATTAAAARAALGDLVAIFLDDGPSPGSGAASSVVDLRDGTLRVLREGALTRGILESALRDRKAPQS